MQTLWCIFLDDHYFVNNWLRFEKGAQAEIDYVLSKSDTIIPIEVKAGTKGSMQSLYSFMELKKSKQRFLL